MTFAFCVVILWRKAFRTWFCVMLLNVSDTVQHNLCFGTCCGVWILRQLPTLRWFCVAFSGFRNKNFCCAFRICFNSMLRCCFGYRIACGRAVLAAVIEMVRFHYSCGTRKGWVPSALRQISWQALFLVGMWPCSGLRKCCRGCVLRMCLPLQF